MLEMSPLSQVDALGRDARLRSTQEEVNVASARFSPGAFSNLSPVRILLTTSAASSGSPQGSLGYPYRV